MKFVGRENELTAIHEKLHSKKSEQILIYGRRRIGKSELIKQALKDCEYKIIHYVCRKTTYEDNFSSLANAVLSVLPNKFVHFSDLGELLEYVYEAAKNEPIILFIDEYSFFRINDGIDSWFQIAIDQFQNESNVKLILCGSYVDIMSKIIEKNAPLYGRFTMIMKLTPLDYYDVAKFIPNESLENKVFYYSCFGGIPYYWTLIDNTLSPEENLEKLFLPENSIIENEIENQLMSEISKLSNANIILDVLAASNKTYSDIETAVSQKGVKYLPYILNQLQQLDMIQKNFPINDASRSKSTLYEICDNTLLFYYTYLFHNKSARSFMTPKQFYKDIGKDILNRFIPHRFECIAKEYLIRMNKGSRMDPPFSQIGRFIYHDAKNKKTGEFDIVTKDKKGYTSYECKYTNKPITLKIIQQEIQQIQDLHLNFYQLGFISKSGFEDDIPNEYTCITLNDMYR